MLQGKKIIQFRPWLVDFTIAIYEELNTLTLSDQAWY
jgi:hypothetical protein